jgi:hypothetical protein
VQARRAAVLVVLLIASLAAPAFAQNVSQRGFADARATIFAQEALNDPTQVVGDVFVREELFAKPLPWLQLAAGADLRLNSHGEVEEEWRFDLTDRGIRRPHLSLRRATATIAYRKLTLDVGKQFVRWGKADILNPTDRFAPRDYLAVVDTEFVPVTGVRAIVQAAPGDSFDVVWVPWFTPSRLPLLDQRWSPIPADVPSLQVVDQGAVFPTGPQAGIRWSHVGDHLEYSASFFNGFNHLPNIDQSVRPDTFFAEVGILKRFPPIRAYGTDVAIPTRWLTFKGEAAYLTSTSATTDDYVQYVVQVERQSGEWVFAGGYAGEVVTARRGSLAFAPDRGLTRSLTGHASYTIDSNQSLAFEAVVRQTLAGAYWKGEYSRAAGQHWRTTASGVLIAGDDLDFLGRYHRNSYVSLGLRYSF